MRPYSRGIACPKFCHQPHPPDQRAQGRPGARRTRGLMCGRCNKMLHMSIQVWRNHTGLPCAMALRLIRDRPGDRLSCHHPRARLLPRHELTPAPGRRTLTISPYANVALVSRNIASTATCPTSATMANAPLAGQDGGSHKVDLPDGASGFLPDGLICRTPSGSA